MLDVHVQIQVSNKAFSRYLLYWRIGAGVAKDERGHCSELKQMHAIKKTTTTRVVRRPRKIFSVETGALRVQSGLPSSCHLWALCQVV